MASQVPEEIPLTPNGASPIVCKCGATLGASTARTFFVGSSVNIETRVTIVCRRCGRKRTWRPANSIDTTQEEN